MKINLQILSIPPYISTSWKNIASLHVEDADPSFVLVVTLLNGTRIEIPHLDPSMLEAIFTSHARFMEQDVKTPPAKTLPRLPMNLLSANENVLSMEIPFKNGLMEMQGLGTLLEHNAEQADAPNLPQEVLEKVTELAKTMGIEDASAFPKPEPQCNCMRCQIAKAMQEGLNKQEETKVEIEEIVKDEDLHFKNWDVKETQDKLFVVTNRLDTKEEYHVFLGEPLGCTCGQKDCEHIKAALDS